MLAKEDERQLRALVRALEIQFLVRVAGIV
jgi:hypothetical protein